MILKLQIETRDIKKIPEKSHYNYICHEFHKPIWGITHIIEIYDDIHENEADYQLGVFEDGKFICKLSGIGDSVPEGKENCGGVNFEVDIYYPELSFKLKK